MIPCRLKARRFSLSVLEIHEADPERIGRTLDDLLQAGGELLKHAPVVLDVTRVEDQGPDGVEAVAQAARARQLAPCGIIASEPFFEAHGDRLAMAHMAREEKSSPRPGPDTWRPTRLVTSPVRSGQQIYARNQDLVVLAPVSEGAEVIADGNVHVYGTLRGRAIAGASGREEAHIFASDFRAELIAVAGQYRVSEDQPATVQGKAVQARLAGGKLLVERL